MSGGGKRGRHIVFVESLSSRMFEVAWSELLLVVIVAILVVGPKELPGLMRTAGRMLAKLRRTAEDFRRQFDEAVKEAGGEDLQREMNALRQHNPINQIRNSIEEAARDSYSPRTGTLPESAVADDLPPPPPLPPRTDGIFGGASPDPQAAAPGETSAAAAPPPPAALPTQGAPASPAKELSDGGPAPETRINGEHRPTS
jgi:sec-independent protein translocase protein TatB